MLLRRLGRKAQTTAEYAILIGLVVGAVIAMQVYVKRGLQGRMRDAVDHVGANGDVGGTDLAFTSAQYEPYYLQSTATTDQTSHDDESLHGGGQGGVDRSTTTNTTAVRNATTGW